MSDIIPMFTSDYSLNSVLKIKEAGKSKKGGPISIIDACIEHKIKNPFFLEKTMSGIIDAYKHSEAAGLKMRFGYKVTTCADDQDKTPESKLTESRVNVFIKNGKGGIGYYDLIALHNHSTKNGFYEKPRISWDNLKKFWTPNLLLAIPFYGSFIHRNLLEGTQCVPDFSFTDPFIFEELNNNLPFDSLIKKGLDRLDLNFERVPVQSIYYYSPDHFDSFLTYECIQRRSCLSKPNISHMASKEFNLTKLFN